ncbi:NUDIX domain-containing protein [Comamonadaceae bacterium OH2545_COT-014]|nr:NUDIX domain-containing protein [Comamonadaceae bacterium OH2545_COT-014]
MELNQATLDTPARDAASIVMLRDGPAGLQVLLVRRHANATDLGGACVFPGGKVDAGDSAPEALARLDVAADGLPARLGEHALAPHEAAAFFVAAAREAFEEVGLLYTHHGGPAATGLDAAARASLLDGTQAFAALLARQGLTLDTAALVPWSRWITPRQPAVMTRRFDTRFFLAAAPAGQTPVGDDHEVTELLWLTPREALARYRDHLIDLAPPQIISLAHLARYASAAQALQDARQRPPPRIAPEPFLHHGARALSYPGDPCHSETGRALPTPTRLVFQNRRFLPEEGFDAFFA